MNEVKIPEGWEECYLTSATAALAPDGTILHLDPNKNTIEVEGSFGTIASPSWKMFGIIPIRKAPPPAPIEFVVEEVMSFDSGTPAGVRYSRPAIIVPKGVKPGMRFREVVE